MKATKIITSSRRSEAIKLSLSRLADTLSGFVEESISIGKYKLIKAKKVLFLIYFFIYLLFTYLFIELFNYLE